MSKLPEGKREVSQSQPRNFYYQFFSYAKTDVKEGGIPFSWNAPNVLKYKENILFF